MQAVLGSTGGAGRAILRQLGNKEEEPIGISRSGWSGDHFQGRAADIMDYSLLVESLRGADVVYNCVNFRYDQWFKYLPKATENVIKACAEVGTNLVVVDNLYMYDPSHMDNLSENTPVAPKTRKGKLRAQIADKYIQAHKEGGVEVLILRGSDFYGPGIQNAVVSAEVIDQLAQGKKPYLLGNPNALHSFTFIDDMANAAVNLAERENAYGEVWHAPNAPAVTQEEFLGMFATELGTELGYQKAKPWMLRIAGIFNPVIREVREMVYQFENDFVVNDDKIRSLGFEPTPLEEGVRRTIEWFRTDTE